MKLGIASPIDLVSRAGREDADPDDLRTPVDFSCTADKTTETLKCKCSCLYQNADGSLYERSPCDGNENTYKCLRTINATEDSSYCEFDDGYVEYYDTKSDPWSLTNLAVKGRTPIWKLQALSLRLYAFMKCSG